MTTDLQLFILWNNGRKLEEKILSDLSKHYEIIGKCEVFWPQKHFARNLARFYGKNLRKGAKKIRECGTGPFLLIVIRDPAPKYFEEKNVNMSTSKHQYRGLFGGGYMVHASDSQAEAFENFLLLTGRDIAEFAAARHKNMQTIGDLIGAVSWNNKTEIQTILQKIPGCRLECSENVWLLQTPDPGFAARLLNAKKCWFGKNLFRLKISGKKQKIRIVPSF